MVKFTKVDYDITQFKPKMKPIYVSKTEDLRKIPFVKEKTTVQVKGDGEFNLIHIDRNQIYAVNRFGRKTEDLPALKELHNRALTYSYVEECDLLAEMYAVDEKGLPLSLPNFIHYLKGEDKTLQNNIRLGLFDFIQVKFDFANKRTNQNGRMSSKNYDSENRFQLLDSFNGTLCHTLQWSKPKTWKEIEEFWHQKVEIEKWEGIVIRANGDIWKVKPNRDVDAVVIGINKNNKGFEKGLAKSLKVALMQENHQYVELGDATVPTNAEASELFNELTRIKVNEDNSTVFVKPLLVVQINYISLFPETTNKTYKLLLGGYFEAGTTKLARMKSPRIVAYRKDKYACPEDTGINQVGE